MDHPDYEREHWRQIDDLFAQALDRPPDERAAFLDEACAATSPLRANVEALLAASDASSDAFLHEIDLDQAAALIESVDEPALTGQQIGPYRILRELGRGGMGAVYLAERADGQFDQQVALKLIKRGMDSEAILRRFLHERQILARLQHVNIARLLDGGVSADGQPYFAMEYVEGVSMTAYCDGRRLEVEARLRLFEKVCRAVQYAHANLVVHRDLKPSNMLVTEAGELKLLDFGIAKVLGDDAQADGATLTEAGFRVMTPEYAAPEQVRGEAVTTATDVYALGVVLYELLTGHRPYQFERRTPEAVARVIGEAQPERPSTAVSRSAEVRRGDGTMETITPEEVSRARGTKPERLSRRLSGDLDVVVLKALRKEPERRYASAEAFVEDIQRHLAGMPVGARRDTVGYRASKFVQRHKVGVAASAALAVLAMLAVGFAVAMALQQAKTARETTKTEEVKDFLVSLFEVSDPDESKGETITARELLDEGAARVETELADQPEVQAEMMTVVGEIYQKLGLYDPARPLLERALTLRQSLYGPDHLEVAASLVQLGRLYHQRGDYEAADSFYREALDIRQARRSETHLDVAEVLDDLALVRWRQGDYPAADSLGRSALALRRKLLPADHPAVAESLTNLGVIARAQSDFAAAEAYHREALTIRRAQYGTVHHLVAESLKNLALVFHSQDRYDEAEAHYREALAVQKRLYGEGHPEIGTTLNSLGSLLRMKGAYDEAEAPLREALAVRRQFLGPAHVDIATTLVNLADLLDSKGNPEAALLLYEEALTMNRQLLGPDHPDVATAINNLALTLRGLGRSAEAEPLFKEVARIYRARLGLSHPWVSLVLDNLAIVQFDLRDYAAADSLFRQALAIQREALPDGHTWIAASLVGLGHVLLAQGRPEEAEPLLREALDIQAQALPQGHWRRAEVQNVLGACLSALERLDEAEPLLVEGYSGLKKTRGDWHLITQYALRYLVAHYEQRGLPEQAAAYRRGTSGN